MDDENIHIAPRGGLEPHLPRRIMLVAILSVLSTALLTVAISLLLALRSADHGNAALGGLVETATGFGTTPSPRPATLAYGEVLRFIRLEHGGVGWDDGMLRADADFLNEFQQVRQIAVAPASESIKIEALARFRKDDAPPFVFLTGTDEIEGLSPADMAILGHYVEEGGTLIADSGSASFDRSFRKLMKNVFPDRPLREIRKGDLIYTQPIGLRRSGQSLEQLMEQPAMCIRIDESRLGVIYVPNNIHSVWDITVPRTSRVARANAVGLGVNFVSYALASANEQIKKAHVRTWRENNYAQCGTGK